MHFFTTFLTVVLTESSTIGTGVEKQVLRARPRQPWHMLPQIQTTVKPSTFGLKFQKCAQVETGSEFPQVTLYLVISNPPEGTDLSQLGIRDAISDITLLQNNGNVQERGYQTFTTDSLPAGSNYVVTYMARVKGSKTEVLFLPAFLTFSNASQNDINLFGPVIANFTLRLNTTEKVSVNHALHFAGFCGAFLVSTLLFSLALLSASCLYNKCHAHSPHNRRKRGFSGGAEAEEAVCNISESANEEATFENKIIDIMALEDPQNVFQALDNLEMSTLLRGALAVERVRVQVVKGLFGVLLGSLGAAGRRVVTVLLGQVTGMEGKLQEEQGARLATLAAQCTMETQQEMETQHHAHATEKTQAERLFHHAEQQEVLQCTMLLEKLQKLEQEQLQRGLLARHEQASAEAQRHTALRRRVELHTIFSEEMDEAARMGELDKDTASKLLHLYYTCQDQLEEVFDLFVASQRAALSERQVQRRFLLQSLHGLQGALFDTLSTSSQYVDSWFAEIRREGGLSDQQCAEQLEIAQLELLRIKQTLEETLSHERSTIHCDLIKRRRTQISEMLCEQKREQQELGGVCEGPVDQYLLRWQTLLSAHSTQFSELITHLDQEAAAEIRKVLLRVLQEAVVELKAVGNAVSQSLQTLGVPRWLLQREVGGEAVAEAQERLRVRGKEMAATLRILRSSIQQRRLQELQQQRQMRERLEQYCRSVCASQWALSETDLLRVRLECVKCVCRLDRCLVLPRALSRARLYTTLTHTTGRHAQPDPSAEPYGPSLLVTKKGLSSRECSLEPGVCAGDTGDLQSFRRRLEERIHFLQQERERESSAEEEEFVCDDVKQQVFMCEQSVAGELAALQWERAERRSRVLETHSALLSLQTLLLQHLRHTPTTQELSHAIHTHSLALDEAELQLQKEESEWEEIAFGHGSDKVLAAVAADELDEEILCMDKDNRMAANLQEALCRREELTHILTERLREAGRRRQVMEDLRDQLELKRLYTLCDQDLVLSAALVKLHGVSVMSLQELLRLLLPSLPEGELQSLTDALSPKAGKTPGPCRELVGRLRNDIISKNLATCTQLTDREMDRLLKKKQNLLEKLFTSSLAGPSKGKPKVSEQESGHQPKISTAQQPATSQPVSASVNVDKEFAIGPRPGVGGTRKEGVWPTDSTCGDEAGVAIESVVSGEKLFIFRSPPPANQEPTSLTSAHGHRKKRSFLMFKKGTVAPQEQT
ncbi:limbin [Pygocentrus nattereri]|uniref:limbin n=1 Tax=Pygocentrus nattereri TaxID=42514 RepID=UPI00081433CD|nr:limbin [Pygocentrus nattereri]XP_037400378.1 limbin [Pygocentrus nattereri]